MISGTPEAPEVPIGPHQSVVKKIYRTTKMIQEERVATAKVAADASKEYYKAATTALQKTQNDEHTLHLEKMKLVKQQLANEKDKMSLLNLEKVWLKAKIKESGLFNQVQDMLENDSKSEKMQAEKLHKEQLLKEIDQFEKTLPSEQVLEEEKDVLN